MHAFDCFLEQLTRRVRDRRGEKGTFAKEPVVRESESESEVPFRCDDFEGKKNRHADKYYS